MAFFVHSLLKSNIFDFSSKLHESIIQGDEGPEIKMVLNKNFCIFHFCKYIKPIQTK